MTLVDFNRFLDPTNHWFQNLINWVKPFDLLPRTTFLRRWSKIILSAHKTSPLDSLEASTPVNGKNLNKGPFIITHAKSGFPLISLNSARLRQLIVWYDSWLMQYNINRSGKKYRIELDLNMWWPHSPQKSTPIPTWLEHFVTLSLNAISVCCFQNF